MDKTTVRETTELPGNIWNILRIQQLDASKTIGFFFLVVIFFSLFVYMKTLRMMQPKGKIKSKQPSALFFFKASHHLLIKERFSKPAPGPLFSPRKSLGRVSPDSLENKQIKHNTRKLKECVWYHVSLSVVVHSTGRMHIQHTALLHNWIYLLIAYYRVVEGMTPQDVSNLSVPWMLFQCSALAIPSPVTLLRIPCHSPATFSKSLNSLQSVFSTFFSSSRTQMINWGTK